MEDYKKIKENWYMAKWKEKTDKSKIQFVIEIKDTYIFMVSDWLTDEEVKSIDLSKWNFTKIKMKEENQ